MKEQKRTAAASAAATEDAVQQAAPVGANAASAAVAAQQAAPAGANASNDNTKRDLSTQAIQRKKNRFSLFSHCCAPQIAGAKFSRRRFALFSLSS